MMKLWDEYAEVRDKWAVLAIHNPHPLAPTFEKLDAILEERGTLKKWGRNLPFTIVIDNTGTTVKNYGVQAYPTHVLIDPEGKVVKGGERELAAKLKEMKEALKPKEGETKPPENKPDAPEN
jgi:hypothetical protein